jgi:hypothetical protein
VDAPGGRVNPEALYWSALSASFWLALWDASRRVGGGPDAARLVAGLALGAGLARLGGLLFAPVGLLFTAPREWSAAQRFLDATLPAFPLAFAAAKLGCAAAGCCAAAVPEALGFLALAGIVRGAPSRHEGPLALAGLGFVRLALLPFRPEALFSVVPAMLWLTLGALRCRPSHGGPGCPRPGSEISRRTARSSKPGWDASSRAPASSR